ncbi:hypothetical protein ACIO53_45195 [Streptomyces sp. NPDC087305]|uniref:hypothetical protein n=1 Tax=Streptomyces sp. NPDC087305 TaxID=3365781 RepID=UPI0037FE86F1
MNSDLLNMLATLASGAALAFLGVVANDWQTRRTEARKQRADDRAELEAQADELIAAVIAMKVAGNVHDLGAGSWRTRLIVCAHALTRSAASWDGAGRGWRGVLANSSEMYTVVSQWNQDHTASVAELTAPLSRLGVAAVPLMKRPEQGLAEAAGKVLTTVVDDYRNDDGVTQALAVFREELVAALNAAAAPRRRLSLPRRSG